MDAKIKIKGKGAKGMPPRGIAPLAPRKLGPTMPEDTEDQGPIPSDIADQLQTSRNERAANAFEQRRAMGQPYKKGGCVKKAKGGSVGSASKRADGCAQRGKTKGRMI